jgi:hypothetical protein
MSPTVENGVYGLKFSHYAGCSSICLHPSIQLKQQNQKKKKKKKKKRKEKAKNE